MGERWKAAADLASRLGGQAPPPKYIRAYHGSPYDWNRVDMSKIGTGEGAQSFGHGFYAAQAEEVAQIYKDQLAQRYVATPKGEQIPMPEWITDEKLARDGAKYYRDRVKQLMEGRSAAGQPLTDLPDDLRAMEALVGGGALKRNAHMYELEIGHPESAFLDLDAPVLSQPKAIQEALGQYARAPRHFTFGQEGWRGQDAYWGMASDLAGANRKTVLHHDQPAASAALFQAGVPGAKYFDEVSRATAEGTRNYVMFPGTEDSIRILRKYGLLAPMAVGGMGADQQ